MIKWPLTVTISCRNIPAHEKIDFVIILFKYFNLQILEGETSIDMLRFYKSSIDTIPHGDHHPGASRGDPLGGAAAPQNLQKQLIGKYFLFQGLPGDCVVSRADQFAGVGD